MSHQCVQNKCKNRGYECPLVVTTMVSYNWLNLKSHQNIVKWKMGETLLFPSSSFYFPCHIRMNEITV